LDLIKKICGDMVICFNYIIKLLAYAPIGKPAILKIGKKLDHNMTFTVSLSPHGVEFIQTFTSGGQTNGTFEIYYEKLIN
jgi:hypothetical protein